MKNKFRLFLAMLFAAILSIAYFSIGNETKVYAAEAASISDDDLASYTELSTAASYTADETHYKISSLASFKVFLGLGSTKSNDVFVLTANIDFDGDSSNAYMDADFQGTFIGGGHLISNYSLTGTTTYKCSMFGDVYGTIRDVNFNGISLSQTTTTSDTTLTTSRGLICQLMEDAVLEGVEVCGLVTSSGDNDLVQSAGIVNKNMGIIRNVSLVDSKVFASKYAGGIAAENEGRIEKCKVEMATIYGVVNSGGISAYGNSSSYISSCAVHQDSKIYQGLFDSENGNLPSGIEYTYNTYTNFSTGYVGGIQGYLDGGKIINCYVLKGQSHSTTDPMIYATAGNIYIAGICGTALSNAVFADNLVDSIISVDTTSTFSGVSNVFDTGLASYTFMMSDDTVSEGGNYFTAETQLLNNGESFGVGTSATSANLSTGVFGEYNSYEDWTAHITSTYGKYDPNEIVVYTPNIEEGGDGSIHVVNFSETPVNTAFDFVYSISDLAETTVTTDTKLFAIGYNTNYDFVEYLTLANVTSENGKYVGTTEASNYYNSNYYLYFYDLLQKKWTLVQYESGHTIYNYLKRDSDSDNFKMEFFWITFDISNTADSSDDWLNCDLPLENHYRCASMTGYDGYAKLPGYLTRKSDYDDSDTYDYTATYVCGTDTAKNCSDGALWELSFSDNYAFTLKLKLVSYTVKYYLEGSGSYSLSNKTIGGHTLIEDTEGNGIYYLEFPKSGSYTFPNPFTVGDEISAVEGETPCTLLVKSVSIKNSSDETVEEPSSLDGDYTVTVEVAAFTVITSTFKVSVANVSGTKTASDFDFEVMTFGDTDYEELTTALDPSFSMNQSNKDAVTITYRSITEVYLWCRTDYSNVQIHITPYTFGENAEIIFNEVVIDEVKLNGTVTREAESYYYYTVGDIADAEGASMENDTITVLTQSGGDYDYLTYDLSDEFSTAHPDWKTESSESYFQGKCTGAMTITLKAITETHTVYPSYYWGSTEYYDTNSQKNTNVEMESGTKLSSYSLGDMITVYSYSLEENRFMITNIQYFKDSGCSEEYSYDRMSNCDVYVKYTLSMASSITVEGITLDGVSKTITTDMFTLGSEYSSSGEYEGNASFEVSGGKAIFHYSSAYENFPYAYVTFDGGTTWVKFLALEGDTKTDTIAFYTRTITGDTHVTPAVTSVITAAGMRTTVGVTIAEGYKAVCSNGDVQCLEDEIYIYQQDSTDSIVLTGAVLYTLTYIIKDGSGATVQLMFDGEIQEASTTLAEGEALPETLSLHSLLRSSENDQNKDYIVVNLEGYQEVMPAKNLTITVTVHEAVIKDLVSVVEDNSQQEGSFYLSTDRYSKVTPTIAAVIVSDGYESAVAWDKSALGSTPLYLFFEWTRESYDLFIGQVTEESNYSDAFFPYEITITSESASHIASTSKYFNGRTSEWFLSGTEFTVDVLCDEGQVPLISVESYVAEYEPSNTTTIQFTVNGGGEMSISTTTGEWTIYRVYRFVKNGVTYEDTISYSVLPYDTDLSDKIDAIELASIVTPNEYAEGEHTLNSYSSSASFYVTNVTSITESKMPAEDIYQVITLSEQRATVVRIINYSGDDIEASIQLSSSSSSIVALENSSFVAVSKTMVDGVKILFDTVQNPEIYVWLIMSETENCYITQLSESNSTYGSGTPTGQQFSVYHVQVNLDSATNTSAVSGQGYYVGGSTAILTATTTPGYKIKVVGSVPVEYELSSNTITIENVNSDATFYLEDENTWPKIKYVFHIYRTDYPSIEQTSSAIDAYSYPIEPGTSFDEKLTVGSYIPLTMHQPEGDERTYNSLFTNDNFSRLEYIYVLSIGDHPTTMTEDDMEITVEVIPGYVTEYRAEGSDLYDLTFELLASSSETEYVAKENTHFEWDKENNKVLYTDEFYGFLQITDGTDSGNNCVRYIGQNFRNGLVSMTTQVYKVTIVSGEEPYDREFTGAGFQIRQTPITIGYADLEEGYKLVCTPAEDGSQTIEVNEAEGTLTYAEVFIGTEDVQLSITVAQITHKRIANYTLIHEDGSETTYSSEQTCTYGTAVSKQNVAKSTIEGADYIWLSEVYAGEGDMPTKVTYSDITFNITAAEAYSSSGTLTVNEVNKLYKTNLFITTTDDESTKVENEQFTVASGTIYFAKSYLYDGGTAYLWYKDGTHTVCLGELTNEGSISHNYYTVTTSGADSANITNAYFFEANQDAVLSYSNCSDGYEVSLVTPDETVELQPDQKKIVIPSIGQEYTLELQITKRKYVITYSITKYAIDNGTATPLTETREIEFEADVDTTEFALNTIATDPTNWLITEVTFSEEGMTSIPSTMPAKSFTVNIVGYEVYSATPTITVDGESFAVTQENMSLADESVKYLLSENILYYSRATEMKLTKDGYEISLGTLPTDYLVDNTVSKDFFYVGVKNAVDGVEITGIGYFESNSEAVLTIVATEGITVSTTYAGVSIDEDTDKLTIASVEERIELELTINYKTYNVCVLYVDITEDPESPVDVVLGEDQEEIVIPVQYSKAIDLSAYATIGSFKTVYTPGDFENPFYTFVMGSQLDDGSAVPSTMPAEEISVFIRVQQAQASEYYVSVDGVSTKLDNFSFIYSDPTSETPTTSTSNFAYVNSSNYKIYYIGSGRLWCQYESQTFDFGLLNGENQYHSYIYSVTVTKNEELDEKTFTYNITQVYYLKNAEVSLDFTVPTGYKVQCSDTDVTESSDNQLTIASISKKMELTVSLAHKSYAITYKFVSTNTTGASLYDDKVSLEMIQNVNYTDAISPMYSVDSIVSMYLSGAALDGLVYDMDTIPATMPAEDIEIGVSFEAARHVTLSAIANEITYNSSSEEFKLYTSETDKTTPEGLRSVIKDGKIYYTTDFYLFITLDEVDYPLESFSGASAKTEVDYIFYMVSFTLGTGVVQESGPKFVLSGNTATYSFTLNEGYRIDVTSGDYTELNETSFVTEALSADITFTVNRVAKTYYIYYYKDKAAYDSYYESDKENLAESKNLYGTIGSCQYLADISYAALRTTEGDSILTGWMDSETNALTTYITMPAKDIVLYGQWTEISIVTFILNLYEGSTNSAVASTVRLSSTKDTFTEITTSEDEFYKNEFTLASHSFSITCGNADSNYIFVQYPGTEEYVYFADANNVAESTTLYHVQGETGEHYTLTGFGWLEGGDQDIAVSVDEGYTLTCTSTGYSGVVNNVFRITVDDTIPSFTFTCTINTRYVYYYKDKAAFDANYAIDLNAGLENSENLYVERTAVVYGNTITYAALKTVLDAKKLDAWYDGETDLAVAYTTMPDQDIVLYGSWVDIFVKSFSVSLYEDGVNGVDATSVKISTQDKAMVELTTEADEIYELTYAAETHTFTLQCTDASTNYVYIKYPGTEEYVYYNVSENINNIALYNVKGNTLTNSGIKGLGWKTAGALDIEFTVPAGYAVQCSNEGYTIVDNVLTITVDETIPTFVFTESKLTYYVYYYQNVTDYNTYYNTDKTDLAAGSHYYITATPVVYDEDITLAATGTILNSQKLTAWYDSETNAAFAIDKMPAKDLVVYGYWNQMAAVDFVLQLFNGGVNAVDANTVRLSSSKESFEEVTTATDEYYQFSFAEATSKYSMYCGDATNTFVFVKYPGTEEYVYFADANNVKDTTLYNVTANAGEHYTVSGLGWNPAGKLVLTFTPEIGYEMTCENDGYEIYTGSEVTMTINNVNETLPVFTFTASLKEYYIFFYMNDKAWRTDTYTYGQTIEWPTPNTGDRVFKYWMNSDEEKIEITTMPAEDMVAYANISTLNNNKVTLILPANSTLTGAMFFLLDSKTDYSEADKVLPTVEDNVISFEYTGNGYLWMNDPVSKQNKSLGVSVSGNPELTFVSVLLDQKSTITHLTVNNLGYVLSGDTVEIEVVPETGYGFTVAGYEEKNNIVTLPTLQSSIELNVQEFQKEYSVYYYVKDELVHEDVYHYLDPVTMWEYDGSIQFDKWSTEITEMPDYSVKVYANKVVEYTQMVYPTALRIHEGQTLGESIISGGLIYIGDEPAEGTYTFKNASYKPVVSDSMTTEFDVIFTEKTNTYYPYEFKLTLEVCNPVYDVNELEEPLLVKATASTITFTMNEKYEYSFDSVNWLQGKEVLLTGYREKEKVTIYYRYMEDNSYCASVAKKVTFQTLSLEQIQYDKIAQGGVSTIDSFQNQIDNDSAREFMAVMKDKFKASFDNAELSVAETEELVQYVGEVLEIMVSVCDARGSMEHINSDRIRDYADHRIDELTILAQNNVSVEKMEIYKDFVVDALNVADKIIGAYNVLAKDLGGLIKLTADGDQESMTESQFVVNKVDELLAYDYENYNHVDLEEYEEEYVGHAVTLMSDCNASIHACDGSMITAVIDQKVSTVQYMTYEDFKFDREAYDEAFWLAAEAAIIVHIQAITLAFADAQFLLAYTSTVDAKAKAVLKDLYDALVASYSDYEAFRAMYFEIIGDTGEVLYEDVLVAFQNNVITALTLPISQSLSETEIIIIVAFGMAMVGCLAAAILIKRRRRLAYAD